MEMRHSSTARIVSSVVVTLLLAAMAVGLVHVFVKAAAAAADADEKTRAALGRLAWVGMALVGMSAVLLLWSLARTLRLCLPRRTRSEPTPYVNAWAEAGRRIRAPDEDEGLQPPQAGPPGTGNA